MEHGVHFVEDMNLADLHIRSSFLNVCAVIALTVALRGPLLLDLELFGSVYSFP